METDQQQGRSNPQTVRSLLLNQRHAPDRGQSFHPQSPLPNTPDKGLPLATPHPQAGTPATPHPFQQAGQHTSTHAGRTEGEKELHIGGLSMRGTHLWGLTHFETENKEKESVRGHIISATKINKRDFSQRAQKTKGVLL